MHAFDVLGNWFRPKCIGAWPAERACHTMTTVGENKVALFGGWNESGTLNDLHILSIANEWVIVFPKVLLDNDTVPF